MKTDTQIPKVSILVCTYNRANRISQAFDSVINQTYTDFEFVIVNNGSTDETAEVLKKYDQDERVRLFNLDTNLGCSGGYNYGLDQLRGEWFAVVADDDPLHVDALEAMMYIPESIDSEVTAVTANCQLKSTGELSGKGLDHNQYLDLETIVTKCSGEFWGVAKRELLGDHRLNEELHGHDNTLWYKIDAVAKRYYLHRPVVTFNDEGVSVTNLNKQKDLGRQAEIYRVLLQEDFYWSVLRTHHRKKFQQKCLKGWFFLRIAGEKGNADKYFQMLMTSGPDMKLRFIPRVLGMFKSQQLEMMYKLLSRMPLRFLKGN